MKKIYSLLFFIEILVSCGESDRMEIYNENNTSVVDGIVYDISEKPINGIYKTYYENGNTKMEIQSKDGIPNGDGFFYDENENLKFKGHFNKGTIDGKLYNYTSNGNVKNELNFKNGVLNGVQRVYDDQGFVIVEVEFKDGMALTGFVMKNGEKADFTSEDLKLLETNNTINNSIN